MAANRKRFVRSRSSSGNSSSNSAQNSWKVGCCLTNLSRLYYIIGITLVDGMFSSRSTAMKRVYEVGSNVHLPPIDLTSAGNFGCSANPRNPGILLSMNYKLGAVKCHKVLTYNRLPFLIGAAVSNRLASSANIVEKSSSLAVGFSRFADIFKACSNSTS